METSGSSSSPSVLTKKRSKLKIVRIASRIRNSPSITKREALNTSTKSNFPTGVVLSASDDIAQKLKNLSNNVIENMRDIDGHIEGMYKMVNEYSEEREKVLTKNQIQEALRSQFSFYKMSKAHEALINTRKNFKNDAALLGSDFKVHDNPLKHDASNEGNLIHLRNYLLETPHPSQKGTPRLAKNDLSKSKDASFFFNKRKFSEGDALPPEKKIGLIKKKRDEEFFSRLELQKELRQRLIDEIENPKPSTRIEERLLELKNSFIPTQFKKFEILKSIGERKLMQKEMTSRNYAHTIYYEILAMPQNKQDLIQRRFSTFLPHISRYKTFNALNQPH